MDFNLTTEQIDIQKAAGEFANGEFDPDAALEFDQAQQFPWSIWKKACDLGFIGAHFPEEYGGAGFGLMENVLIIEAFCRQDSGIGMALALSDFGSEMIMKHGKENQKKGILPLIAQGKQVMTVAFLEQGYSLGPFETTGILTEDGYTVHGKKSFVPLGALSDQMIVLCQNDPDNPFAQSALLIEKGMDGLEVQSMGEKVGMRMIPMTLVSLIDVKVPRENVIGQEGEGHSQMGDFLNDMRIEAGAMGVGIAQGGLDMAIDYSKKREAFGKAIMNFDAIRNKLADMYIEVEMARLVTYRAACSFDQGTPDHRSTLLSKMIASRAARMVTHDALQIHGGQGYMKEAHIEQFYRDARVMDLFLEPAQVQRNLLADEITGRKTEIRSPGK